MNMNTVKLRSGASMPKLGIGTWQCGGDEMRAAISLALRAGYRHIDCAFAYQNEKAIGEAIKEAIDGGIITRKDLFVTSKLPQHGHRKEDVKHFLEVSLERLGLDYLDLYIIHFPVSTKKVDENNHWPKAEDGSVLKDDDIDLLDTWKGLEECVDEGLVKDIGLSNFNSEQIQRIYDNARIKPANHQIECHVYFQQEPLVNFCHNLGISITCYSPLGSAGSPSFFKDRFGQDFSIPRTVLEESLLKTLSEKYKKSPAQIALRFLIQRGLLIIPKSASETRIKENAQIFDFQLEEKDMEDLRQVDKSMRIFKFDFIPGIEDSTKYPFKAPF